MGIGEKGHPHLQQDLGSLKSGLGEAAEPIPISLQKLSEIGGSLYMHFINFSMKQTKYQKSHIWETPTLSNKADSSTGTIQFLT